MLSGIDKLLLLNRGIVGTCVIKKEWPHHGFRECMEGPSPTASFEIIMEAVPAT